MVRTPPFQGENTSSSLVGTANIWGVSSAGLERLPVTQKAEGSSPLHPARMGAEVRHLNKVQVHNTKGRILIA